MVIRYRPRSSSVRTSALAAAALVLLPTPAVAVGEEPTPPKPGPVYSSNLLDRPGVQVRPDAGAPAVPSDVSALSWVVADARSGEVLAAHNAHRQLPPASTLKSLFALTALPHLDAVARHRVTQSELAEVGDGSSLVGVEAGRSYTVADLWRGVFLSSGNDAVHVLAKLNGGWQQTVRQMRAKARALGAHDTHVVSPDGYDAAGQVSSAYDLAIFGRAGLADPQFAQYCSTSIAKFPHGNWSYPIQNTNRLLTGADGVSRYPGLLGIKNGYTSHAGNTLISAAQRGSRTLVVSVMNPQASGGYRVYEETRALLDWGFKAAGHVRPVGSLVSESERRGTAQGPAPDAEPAAHAIGSGGPAWTTMVFFAAGSAAVVVGATALFRRRRAARAYRFSGRQ
ncbi:D-alanyl-D-alanine carboxypeptidase family protein [Streptomyces sp. NPDC054855]